MIRDLIQFIKYLFEKPTYVYPIGPSDAGHPVPGNQKRLEVAVHQLVNRNSVEESELRYSKEFIEREFENYVDGKITQPEDYYLTLSRNHYLIQSESNKIESKKREAEEDRERERERIRKIVEERRKN